jgi:hypothetical protein
MDNFVLASNQDALRPFGIPYRTGTAIRKAKRGEFLAPTKLGPHRTGWFESELRQWWQAHTAKIKEKCTNG